MSANAFFADSHLKRERRRREKRIEKNLRERRGENEMEGEERREKRGERKKERKRTFLLDDKYFLDKLHQIIRPSHFYDRNRKPSKTKKFGERGEKREERRKKKEERRKKREKENLRHIIFTQ